MSVIIIIIHLKANTVNATTRKKNGKTDSLTTELTS